MPDAQLIVITRPEPDATLFAKQLEKHAFKCLVEPLFLVHPLAVQQDSRNHQAIIATSRHAIKALAENGKSQSIPLLTVGKASAEYARHQGFEKVVYAEGDVTSLLALIKNDYRPGKGSLLYVRGKEITLDIVPILKQSGFNAEEVIAYFTEPALILSLSLRTALKNKQIAMVTFFSERTAHIYNGLVAQYNLSACHASVTALCISRKVANRIKHAEWKNSITAQTPDSRGMLKKIYDFSQTFN